MEEVQLNKNDMELTTRIVTRNDTQESWKTANPLLLKGEIGIEDSTRVKIGDGVTPWNSLQYFSDYVVVEARPPLAVDNDYPVGTIWVFKDTVPKAYIYSEDAGSKCEWIEILTLESIHSLGIMLEDGFCTLSNTGTTHRRVDKSVYAQQLEVAKSIGLTDDVTGSAQFDGSKSITITAKLKNIGKAGSYVKPTVDATGRVVGSSELLVTDLPTIPTSKISGLGSAATANMGLSKGNIPMLVDGGKLPESVVPPLAITEVNEANSQTAMLALTAQTGDVCIRTDLSKCFILGGTGVANVVANWKEMRTPTDAVQSVNGKTGNITLSTTDIAEGTRKYYTDARVNSYLTSRMILINGGGAQQ